MTTIGVSVAVPEPWGSDLQRYRIEVGDDAARLIPTHITLLPPYEVEECQVDAVRRHLAEVAGDTRPFRVHLRGTGTFRPVSPVVFVGVVEGISACEQLAADVQSGPLAVQRTFPYHPHVTVAHDVVEPQLDRAFDELADYVATFEVGAFHLYVQDGGGAWTPVHAFRLGQAAG